MKLKGLVFDYNGVLSDDLRIIIQIYTDVANENGSKVTFDEMWAELAIAPVEKFRKFLPSEKQDLAEKCVEEKSRRYSEIVRTQNVLFPLTSKVIPLLSKKYRLAIITHTNTADLNASFPTSLNQYFDVIWSSDDMQKYKPHPHSLEELLNKWKLKPTEVAYVGDSYNDMRFAKNAGTYAIGITTGESTQKELEKSGADKVINNLNELLELEKP